MNHLFIIWLGQAIGAAALSVLQAATVGSIALVNVVFDSTQGTPAMYVGSQQVLNPTAGGLKFPTNGTQTGITLVDGTTGLNRFQTFSVPFTATGGTDVVGQYYDTALLTIPWSGSGVITGYSTECKNAQLSIVGSGGIVRGVNQKITASRSFPNLVRTFSTGSAFGSFTGFLLTRSGDAVKFSTHTTIAKTSTAPDCKLWITGYQSYNTR